MQIRYNSSQMVPSSDYIYKYWSSSSFACWVISMTLTYVILQWIPSPEKYNTQNLFSDIISSYLFIFVN